MKYIKIVPRLLRLCICSLDPSILIFKSSKSYNACVYTRMKRLGTEPQIGRLLPSRQVAFIFCQRLFAQSRMGEELQGDFSHTHKGMPLSFQKTSHLLQSRTTAEVPSRERQKQRPPLLLRSR